MFLSALPTKNAKMDEKNSILEKKRTLREMRKNECLIVSQEPQGKKRKNSCICKSFLDTIMLKLMNNTLN